MNIICLAFFKLWDVYAYTLINMHYHHSNMIGRFCSFDGGRTTAWVDHLNNENALNGNWDIFVNTANIFENQNKQYGIGHC